MGALSVVVARLRAAWRWPPAAAWAEVLAWGLALGAAFVLPACASGLVLAPEAWGAGWWMPLRVVLAPAAVEEIVFRVAPNPHPREAAGPGAVRRAAAGSLAAYVGSHLVTAWVRPETREVMLDPVFLTAAAALGAGAWVLYRRWGSLGPPVALHAAVVVAWSYAGGQQVLA